MKILSLKGDYARMAKFLHTTSAVHYQDLLAELDTATAVYDFLNCVANMCDTVGDNYPSLYQGDGDWDIWQNQPVCWDGWFKLDGDELWYEGHTGPSGFGKVISRQVMLTDIIEWHSAQPISTYNL